MSKQPSYALLSVKTWEPVCLKQHVFNLWLVREKPIIKTYT